MSELDVLLDYMLGDKAVTLEYRFQKGEQLTYKASLNSEFAFRGDNFPPEESRSRTEILLAHKVKEINYNDSFDLEIVTLERKKTVEGRETEMPPLGEVLRLRMLKNGMVTHSTSGPSVTFPPFPQRPLMKGESWQEENQLNLPGYREAVPFVYTLLDFEEIDGIECAVLEAQSSEVTIPLEAGGEQNVRVRGVSYFDHQNGRLLKSEVESASEIPGYDWKVESRSNLKVELVHHQGIKKAPAISELPEIPEEFMVVDPIINEKLHKKD